MKFRLRSLPCPQHKAEVLSYVISSINFGGCGERCMLFSSGPPVITAFTPFHGCWLRDKARSKVDLPVPFPPVSKRSFPACRQILARLRTVLSAICSRSIPHSASEPKRSDRGPKASLSSISLGAVLSGHERAWMGAANSVPARKDCSDGPQGDQQLRWRVARPPYAGSTRAQRQQRFGHARKRFIEKAPTSREESARISSTRRRWPKLWAPRRQFVLTPPASIASMN